MIGLAPKQEGNRGFIRIANIIEDGRYGGPQARIVVVAEGLRSEGIETIIICPNKASLRFCTEALKRGVEISTIPMHRLSRNPFQIVKYFLSFPKEVFFIRKLLRKEHIDIVHCNSVRQFKGIVAGWLARRKIIWHLNDTWNPIIIKALFFLIAPLSNYFIVSGERVKKYYHLETFLKDKPLWVIRPPVDCEIFDPMTAIPTNRFSLYHGIKILSLGNINPIKGYEYFLEAIFYLNKLNEKASYFIVGKKFSSQKNYVAKLNSIKENRKLHNFYFCDPSNRVQSILRETDIFVCSSLAESGPMSVWEAMAMEKAIVSTDVGDVRHFIKDGHNGFVVPVGDARALAEKIGILIKDPALCKRFGREARAVAIRELDLKITVRKHVEVYHSCFKDDVKRY
jgi:glycosyltransferase involved in cell wall biosynthesis